jgi:CBS domain-containing membrane protein
MLLRQLCREVLLAVICALVIGWVAWISDAVLADSAPMLMASLGASVLIVIVLPESPAARAWSVFGGQTLSALVGLIAAHYWSDTLHASMMVMLGVVWLMLRLNCLHPPGAATALLPVINRQWAYEPLSFLAVVIVNVLVLWTVLTLSRRMGRTLLR